MSILDRLLGLLGRARDTAAQHPDKVSGALDTTARVIDQRTGGRFSGQIAQGRSRAEQFLRQDGASGPGPEQGQAGDRPSGQGDGPPTPLDRGPDDRGPDERGQGTGGSAAEPPPRRD